MADNKVLKNKYTIAKNIALLLHDGDFVNLGVGLPTLVGDFIPDEMTVYLHGENGIMGQDKLINLERDEYVEWEETHSGENGDWKIGHKDVINAGLAHCTLLPGACCFDSAMAFVIARGGHLDATILGGLQVDVEGNLANWMVPGHSVPGMGGAMDLVVGAKKVIVAMEHTAKDGSPKLLKKCTFPLTAVHCVNMVVTELCTIDVVDGEFIVTGMMPGISREELIEKTDAPLKFADVINEMVVYE